MNAGAKIVPAKRIDRASPESERKWKQFLHDIVNAQENNFDYILKVYAEAGFLPLKTMIERVAALHLEFPISDEELRTATLAWIPRKRWSRGEVLLDTQRKFSKAGSVGR